MLVVEREQGPAMHQTGHNSGVIHAGVYYAPGSLEARLCVEGAARMFEYCELRGIAFERIGKLVVAVRPSELPADVRDAGMHLTPRIDGEVLLRPSALLAGARDGYGSRAGRARDVGARARRADRRRRRRDRRRNPQTSS